MSFRPSGGSSEPWTSARKYGCLLKKKEDHSMFENPWKNKFMCWVYGQHFKMKPAEIILTKSNGAVREEIVVSGIEEVADLREWYLGDVAKDKKAEKFTLVNRMNGSKISLKADTIQDAETWVAELKKVLDAIEVQEPGLGSHGRPAGGGEAKQGEGYGSKKGEASPTDNKGTKRSKEPKDVDDVATEKLHGRHKFVYSNGDVYEGDWVNGKKHGMGTYTRADGSIYEGEYQRDRKHGQGRCTWVNGNSYVGQWVDGGQQGHGILTCPDGRRYEGEWYMGKQHGRGTFSNREGDVYVGMWNDGSKHGKGKMTSKDGHVYEGEWFNNKKNGHGKHVRPDKSSYDGEWLDDKKHGTGVYVYGNGDKYEGETSNGHKHGYGVFIAANGAKYSGWWREGKKHGKGTYVSASGKEHNGWWKNDQPDPTGGPENGSDHSNDRAAAGAKRQNPTPRNAEGADRRAEAGGGGGGGGGGAGARGAAGRAGEGQKGTGDSEAEQKKKQAEEEATKRADARAAERLAENERMRQACNSSVVIQDLGPQLEAIKKAAKVSPKALIQHIYKFHPPKKEGETVPTDFTDATMKKTILRAIRTYHQDKNGMDAYGLEWHLLCREITKQLNAKFEVYK